MAHAFSKKNAAARCVLLEGEGKVEVQLAIQGTLATEVQISRSLVG